MLAVALAIEFADELVDGAKGAALPLIRRDLGLSYAQVGLLASVPLLVGGLLELPLGLVDVKVAAIDEDWSGLRVVWRAENRR